MSRHVYVYRSECGDCVCTSNGVSPYEQSQRNASPNTQQFHSNNQNQQPYSQNRTYAHQYIPTQYAYSQPQHPQVGVAAPVSAQQAPPSYAMATYSAAPPPTAGAVATPYTQGYEAHDKI